MSHTVVVGLDGSRESAAAADWAAEEALRREAPLRLLQVWNGDDDPRTRFVDPATARGWGSGRSTRRRSGCGCATRASTSRRSGPPASRSRR
ncbi:universal stress protein [Streptomyces sudanensis]|uniref:universal stress protein n=1 Tax=Streptomyces sudanensis TaxID=436397 RepID=UPI0027E514E7|nr:universal stress protein [Streptomyces sudanensis]